MTPKVSVLMPVYNDEKFVGRAIESILGQSLSDFELLIGDDGSTDGTQEVIRSYRDERITLVENPVNKGIVYTRNRLFDLARSNYMAIQDSDDLSFPNRLERQLNYLQAHPECGICGTWTQIINDEDEDTFHWKFFEDHKQIKTVFLFGNHMVTSSVMLNRKAIPLELKFDANFPVAEDFQLWARIANVSGLYILPETLTKYREHPGGISKTKMALIKQKIFEVIVWQLEQFLGEVSSREKEIHFALCNNIGSGVEQKELLDWIHRVITANNQKKFVDPEQLVIRLHDHAYFYIQQKYSTLEVIQTILKCKVLSSNRKWYYIKSILKHRFGKLTDEENSFNTPI